jgi:hypothetical protein
LEVSPRSWRIPYVPSLSPSEARLDFRIATRWSRDSETQRILLDEEDLAKGLPTDDSLPHVLRSTTRDRRMEFSGEATQAHAGAGEET